VLTVLIPWRAQPSRVPAFEFVVDWYRSHLGEIEVRTVDAPDPLFNLAACRNLGMQLVEDPSDVVIISDADTIPQIEPLLAAIDAAATSGLVHLPYTEYHWLGAAGTAQLREGMRPDDCDFELVRGACSGVYVATPETWRSHGGQDERFRGWGFEDAAWYLAHETLLGEAPVRHAGRVYAMHHVAESREGPQYDLNAELMQRYRDSANDAEAMAQLVSAGESAARARSLPAL